MKEAGARKTYQGTQYKERKLEGETNPRTKTKQGKIVEERKHKGKMQNKWPKHVWENQETSARRTYPDHTRGIQLLKNQLFKNAQYMEYEASDEYVLILSNKRRFKQGGS